MPSPNNLRIIYQNLADLSTTAITASPSQALYPTSNLKLDTKGLTWRTTATTVSSTTVRAYLLVDLGTSTNVGGIAMAFTNLNSNTATITVTGYTAPPTLGGTADAPTATGGTVQGGYSATGSCCPWNTFKLPDWGTNPQGANTFAYGGGTYARLWLPNLISTAVRYLLIEINDNYSTSAAGRFIEVSRLIVGNYWSPVYNTGYGMTAGIKDLSEHERTQSGDLISKRGPRFATLTFNLDWLDSSDRQEMTKLLLGNGLPRPLLVSLFPDSTGVAADFERERAHQIYGKMTALPGVTYFNFDFYNTSIELEEV